MMFRAVVGVLLASTLALGACAADSDEDAADETVAESAAMTGPADAGATFTTTARLNLRATASTSGKILLTMPLGASVSVIDAGAATAGFYHVDYKGTEGWAYGAYLKSASGGPAISTLTSTSTDDPTEDDSATTQFIGRKFSSVSLLWQGNWDYLVKCDSYSRAANAVTFYCGKAESRDFVDNDAWLAMPGSQMTRKMCNEYAKVCKGTKCTTAKIVEKSETSSQWEGSTAVMTALGISTGFKSCSSSFGSTTGVTITLAN